MILAGIDEAGYGPTLGPLVVSVSLFRIPGVEPGAGMPDLWERLESGVCRKPDGRRTAVDDSKKLFQQAKGVCDLEEGVLPFIHLREGNLPRDLRSLLRCVARRAPHPAEGTAGDCDSYLDLYPWYRERNLTLPHETFINVVKSRAGRLAAALGSAGIEYLGLAAWPVEVLEFNRELGVSENKAQVSFSAVGSFLLRIWKQYPGEPALVMVDRQGGRMRYGPLLYARLRPRGIRIDEETDSVSSYTLARGRRREGGGEFRVSFATDCEEQCLPVALASMLSKYIREMHMVLFNRFWKEHRRDLKPTAGYSVDARRFLEDIGTLRERLGIDNAILVRRR